MSSSFESFADSQEFLQLIEPSHLLKKVGRSKLYIEWSLETDDEFMIWWKSTQWFRSNNAQKDNKVTIRWIAPRASIYWRNYLQVAQVSSGRPGILCITCETLLEHPHTKSTGTKSLKNHSLSNKCRRTSFFKDTTTRQTQLFALSRPKVSYDYYKDYYTKH
jgi:hypothetical protein